ncbi:MAG: hypothetical protein AAFW60_04670 [Pseudomonadota bacterium]
MGGKRFLSKRTRRYIGAIIATGVTTFMAMNMVPSASAQECGLREATQWQLALNDETVEQSPDYVRGVTEAFLTACPERPEFQDASRIAGRAAADMQDVHGAAAHFRNAGWMPDLVSNFYAISVFHAAGDAKTAWRIRDRMVESWRSKLERHPSVSVSAEPVEHGMIYQLYFSETDRDSGARAAWVAVPFGPGLPATLTFSHDRMRMALRKAKAAEDFDFRYVDLHRCQGRRTLGRIETEISTSDFDTAARAGLSAYLANPDQPSASQAVNITLCAFPQRLLPGPPKP